MPLHLVVWCASLPNPLTSAPVSVVRAATMTTAAAVERPQGQVRRGQRTARAMREQRRLLRLLHAVGCDNALLGRFIGVTKQAVQQWAAGLRQMPADGFAKLVALLPWCLVNAQMQAAGRMDAAEIARLVKVGRDTDELVNTVLADATIGPAVREHWSEINAALRSPAGREMLDALARRYALARPKGQAA